MKKVVFLKVLLVILLGIVSVSYRAQEDKKAKFITVTTLHLDGSKMNSKESWEAWSKGEKEYFDKVISKNEWILRANTLSHYYTADNSEIISVSVYESWEAIDKAWTRSMELAKSVWPEEKVRKEFFEKMDAFYTGNHSDEIYQVLAHRKEMVKIPEKTMVYYVRKSEFASPKDGSSKEYDELRKEYFDNIINKNELVKAYYSYRHAWGSHANEFVEVFVFESLADLEKSTERNEQLQKEYWKDEAKRKEFGKNYRKYFTAHHGDYIYRSEVGLQK